MKPYKIINKNKAKTKSMNKEILRKYFMIFHLSFLKEYNIVNFKESITNLEVISEAVMLLLYILMEFWGSMIILSSTI